MKGYKCCFVICLICVSALLGACGTPLYDLTAEEEALIVQYATHSISKYNMRQEDGMTGILPTDSEAEKETEEQTSEDIEIEHTETEKPLADDEIKEETDSKLEDQIASVKMEEVLGCDGLMTTYKGECIKTYYKEDEYYSEEVRPGFLFYEMKFSVKNQTESAVYLDNRSKEMDFKLVKGNTKVQSEHTILSNSLTFYEGEIAAGESKDLILLFQLPKKEAENLSGVKLQYEDGEYVANIEL